MNSHVNNNPVSEMPEILGPHASQNYKDGMYDNLRELNQDRAQLKQFMLQKGIPLGNDFYCIDSKELPKVNFSGLNDIMTGLILYHVNDEEIDFLSELHPKMKTYLYQANVVKAPASRIQSSAIFNVLEKLVNKTNKKGLASSSGLTIGGIRMWQTFITIAEKRGYFIGVHYTDDNFNKQTKEIDQYSMTNYTDESASNSIFFIDFKKPVSESPVASDYDTSYSMKDQYHGALGTISADLKNQKPDISYDEFDFYYKLDTNAVHYSQNVFVMKNNEQPVYFASLREFNGYLYQFFMAKADGDVSISKERILMGLFKLSKKLKKKGIMTSDTLSYGGKKFWINIVKIALDKNYPVWVNDREEIHPIDKNKDVLSQLDNLNAFDSTGIDIYIGNSPRQSLSESVQGDGYDIYVNQFDGYNATINISSRELRVTDDRLKNLYDDARFDIYRTLEKEKRGQFQEDWNSIERKHIGKLEQNLGNLTEDYLATAKALMHMQVEDTVNDFNTLVTNYSGVTEGIELTSTKLNEHTEDREREFSVDTTAYMDGYSVLLNIQSRGLQYNIDELREMRKTLFELARTVKEKGIPEAELEEIFEKAFNEDPSSIGGKLKQELEQEIYSLTEDFWSTAYSIIVLKTHKKQEAVAKLIEDFKRKHGL